MSLCAQRNSCPKRTELSEDHTSTLPPAQTNSQTAANHHLLKFILAGQITRRVAPSVAPSTGCSIVILILFFRMNIVH